MSVAEPQKFDAHGLPVNGAELIEQPDVSESISAEEYHSLPGVSNTKLCDFLDDPRLYWWKYLSGQYVAEPKAHFDFGTAVHDVCLLQDESRIVVIPPEVLASNGAKSGNAWKQFAAEHAGYITFKQAEYDAVMACVRAVKAHPLAGELLSSKGPFEKLFTCEDSRGLTLRTRPDKLAYWRDRVVVPDIKSTTDTSPGAFVKAIANNRYHCQEYFYKKVLRECPEHIEVDAFIFIAVNKSSPHFVDCYIIDDEFQEIGKRTVEDGLDRLALRTKNNDWLPQSATSAIRLSPPNYLQYAAEYLV